MGAEISYETLLRVKERLLERLALVDAKLEKLRQEHHTEVSVPSSATERLPTLLDIFIEKQGNRVDFNGSYY